MFPQQLQTFIETLEKGFELALAPGNRSDDQLSHMVQAFAQFIPVVTGQERLLQRPGPGLGGRLKGDLGKHLTQQLAHTAGNAQPLNVVLDILVIAREGLRLLAAFR